MKVDQFFNFKMGQVVRENRPILGKYECLLKLFLKSEKGRWPVKIYQF
jgi:hypothetical protein